MRVLLSTIGSRGEAQPVIALAVALGTLGHEALVCAPPDFQSWAESLGVTYVPVGPELHGTAKQVRSVPTPEERLRMIESTVADQFEAVSAAAAGCDVVVGGGALAIAAHSVAEMQGARYVYAAFAPITLPSPHHAPPIFAMLAQDTGTADLSTQWEQERQGWNTMWREPLNLQRKRRGLPPVDDVRSYLFTPEPWLAADPVLAPWPGSSDVTAWQTGAWRIKDPRPLGIELVAFLDAGEPPVFVGFGSMRAPEAAAQAVVDAVRARGRRVVIAKGWSGLAAVDNGPDCLTIGETNHQALFERVAAVVHHGGAGTTTTAALAGVPQIVVPQMFDQPYYGRRVEALGIGTSISGALSVGNVGDALDHALRLDTVSTAREVAASMVSDGALIAARALVNQAEQAPGCEPAGGLH